MIKGNLTEILGSEMVRPTDHPAVVELRPKGSADHRARLEQLVNALLAGYPRVFFCPHEPEEGERSGANYLNWVQAEANTWVVPRAVTANEVMHDPAYPHGWTIYTGPAALSERDWRGGADRVALLAALLRTGSVTAIVVSDPDGTPWLVGLPDAEAN